METAKKILIVDDDPVIQRLWSRALQNEGYEISTASNGVEALELLQNEKFAVIFSDSMMPKMDGKTLLEHLHRLRLSCCVNVLTGGANIADGVAFMRLGACDYVPKPCEPTEITAMARRCVQHWQDREKVLDLTASVAKYEELDRLKSEFISNVTHELKTPLFAMKGAYELLMEGLPRTLDPTSQRLGEVILNNLERLTRLISNILDFAKLERGALKPGFQLMDAKPCVRKVVQSVYPMARQKMITVYFEEAAVENAFLEADPRQLEQILINLLSNAIKFTPEDGRVGIEIKDQGEDMRISVWDTGAGIASEHHRKVFERFYQVDSSDTRQAGGSGIGLAIVKDIVDLHGGRVWVESVPGKGARFNVVLPKKQSAAAPAKAEAAGRAS